MQELGSFDDEIGTRFDAECAAFQGKLIILHDPPLPPRVVTIVVLALLVPVAQKFFRFGRRFPVMLRNLPDAELHARMNERVQTVGPLPQNVVGATSDDDT